MKTSGSLVVGLDIGTTKVSAVVGEMQPDKSARITGVGCRPSMGMSKGFVVDVEKTVDAIQAAIEDAEVTADCEVREVVAGIACGQIKSFNSHGIVPIKDGEVKQSDVRMVVKAAKTVAMPNDQQILHALPTGFVVDNQAGIADPRGIRGVRLEVNCHIVTIPQATMETLQRCAQRTGIRVTDIVLEPLAGAYSALSRAERDQGVAMVDIGGGTTDLIVLAGGSVRHTAVLALGGGHVTNDIAQILRTPKISAERLKVRYGSALASDVPDEDVPVPALSSGPDREVSRQVLCGIIEKRAEEMLELVKREIDKSGYSASLTGGLVLTGGTARLPGLVELAGRVVDLPVRIGAPSGIVGLSDDTAQPEMATGVGLMLYGMQHDAESELPFASAKGWESVVQRVGGWIEKFF